MSEGVAPGDVGRLSETALAAAGEYVALAALASRPNGACPRSNLRGEEAPTSSELSRKRGGVLWDAPSALVERRRPTWSNSWKHSTGMSLP